jgi:hypothetical protein
MKKSSPDKGTVRVATGPDWSVMTIVREPVVVTCSVVPEVSTTVSLRVVVMVLPPPALVRDEETGLEGGDAGRCARPSLALT